MNAIAKNILTGMIFVICLALVIIGQKHIGASGLLMELIGVTGLLTLLFFYNRKYK